MSDVKNLANQEAIDKLKKLVKSADICLFTTKLTELPLATRPMSTQQIDEDGNIWFFSNKESHKNDDIETDNRVQLFFSNKGNFEFLSVYGEATVIVDKEKFKDLWTPELKTWFHDGVDDPNLTLVQIKPTDVYYWDTKSSKAVSILKIAVGTVTGKTLDDGVEGKLDI